MNNYDCYEEPFKFQQKFFIGKYSKKPFYYDEHGNIREFSQYSQTNSSSKKVFNTRHNLNRQTQQDYNDGDSFDTFVEKYRKNKCSYLQSLSEDNPSYQFTVIQKSERHAVLLLQMNQKGITFQSNSTNYSEILIQIIKITGMPNVQIISEHTKMDGNKCRFYNGSKFHIVTNRKSSIPTVVKITVYY